MEISIAANIKAFRKERKLTQEQLAEVLGVTVGAVSKWESGASMPEVGLIMELADFFETSVDVLLGYERQGNSQKRTLERIRALRNAKDFDAASVEAEKALVKYPNSFDVVFAGAVMFCMKGIERGHKKSLRRSIELFERSLELIAQNKNDEINEWTIRNSIAGVYITLGQKKEGLEALKRNNADGLNDGLIGYTLATEDGKDNADEALSHLSNALVSHVCELVRVASGYVNVYGKRGEHARAAEMAKWIVSPLRELKLPGRVSHIDRELVMMLTMQALAVFQSGDEPKAVAALTEARERALEYDADPKNDFEGMRFYCSDKGGTAFDDFGSTTMDGVRKVLKENESDCAPLLAIWDGLGKSPEN